MTRKWRITVLGAACLVLAGCEAATPAGGNRAGAGGELRSEVRLIEGAQFTATWEDGPATSVRLTYDADVAMSDVRLREVGEELTGCTMAGAATDTSLLGEIATVRLPMRCGVRSAGSAAAAAADA